MIVPHRTPFFLPHLFPSSLIWRFSGEQRELYLTFDDGPVPGPTDFVLETLDRFNCPATFFCIGDNIKKNKEVFQRIQSRGHATGNHTFNHLNGWKTSVKEYHQNIEKCEEVLAPDNNATKLFRPPYGRITWKQIHSLQSFRIIMWDVLSVDYESRLSPEKCLRSSIQATRPGSIIVFHDSYKAEKNMRHTLPRYIENCLERGYIFRRIT